MNTPDLSQLNNYSQLGNYNDINALQSIKLKDGTNQDDRLDAVAKQFESVFVSMMLKGMRDANKAFSEGNMMQSSQSDFYQQMFDSQLAVTLSTSKGLGLADVIKRQLSKGAGLEGAELKGGSSEVLRPKQNYSLDSYERTFFSRQQDPEKMKAALAKITERIENLPVQSDDMSRAGAPTNAIDFSSPEAFIESLLPYAKQVELETGIDARLMLAQSALETGWGKHQIMTDTGEPSFNLFGIKAQPGWQGNKAEVTTTEYRQGVPMKERAEFRTYDSYGDSFMDYAKFLKSNERYEPAMAHSENPKAFANALQASGYATDPQYGSKIGRILDQYILGRTDVDTSLGHKE